ncbi:hypothetical protein, partial [Escherichia coli]|uniref:hypothetical protein n=1 Tax=Escherichia coli TaxID=562 RepID=UPI0032E4C2CE
MGIRETISSTKNEKALSHAAALTSRQKKADQEGTSMTIRTVSRRKFQLGAAALALSILAT